MPIKNGVYTPLTNAQIARVETYIARLLRARQVSVNESITRSQRKYKLDQSDTSAIIRAHTNATAANFAAALARRTHNRVLLPSEVPTIAGERSRTGQYRYDLLIQTTDPNTGAVSSQLHSLYTRNLMSLDMVRYNIDANRSAFVRQFQSPPLTANQPQQVRLSTIILQVGLIG